MGRLGDVVSGPRVRGQDLGERAWTSAKGKVPGLPPELRFHDLRHYFASMLIDPGRERRGRPTPDAALQADDQAPGLPAHVPGQR